ncbi:FecR family protein [Chitinophaga sp. CF118]|uniref:FecR family protein n=1 Tax=Chitinophaga sp. CF118 TaxID=1884367 RepID=UPI0008E9119F|nr:FecR family protein [Chitinophaga sp. CF118]SFD01116.1 FecR family protein [Chitinophaga sp. CF118]
MNEMDLKQVYEIRDIILKYLNGNINDKEEIQLNHWLGEKKTNNKLFREIVDQETMILFTTRFKELEEGKAEVFQHICDQIDRPRSRFIWLLSSGKFRYIAAAISILFISMAAFYLINQNSTPDYSIEVRNKDLAPGRNTATLLLADGSVITLDSAENGVLAQQGNAKVIKLDSGQLVYEKGHNSSDAAAAYNTISTPRGGQYQLQLPDGSKVWLNAASSLRFPTVFNDKERKVELAGEAYFEVAQVSVKAGKKIPFMVDILPSPGEASVGQVKVLGTHFNIMAYADEGDIRTTLLEGAVKVTKGASTTLLAPGQQAQMEEIGQIKLVENANIEEVMAWKNGYFQFNRADLPSVMRQIARWYNVDISYEGKIPDRKFGGKISREANASEVLKILELSDVHFRIENKQIVVIP